MDFLTIVSLVFVFAKIFGYVTFPWYIVFLPYTIQIVSIFILTFISNTTK